MSAFGEVLQRVQAGLTSMAGEEVIFHPASGQPVALQATVGPIVVAPSMSPTGVGVAESRTRQIVVHNGTVDGLYEGIEAWSWKGAFEINGTRWALESVLSSNEAGHHLELKQTVARDDVGGQYYTRARGR